MLIGFRVPILVACVAGALSFNIKRGGLLYGKVEDGKVKVSAQSVAKWGVANLRGEGQACFVANWKEKSGFF